MNKKKDDNEKESKKEHEDKKENKKTCVEDVKLEIDFVEKSEKNSIFFRILFLFIQCFIISIWSIWFFIVTIIQLFFIFTKGKRKKKWYKQQVKFIDHVTKWNSYTSGATEKQPKIIPDDLFEI